MIVNTSELLLQLGISATVTDEQLALIQQMQAPVERAVKKYVRSEIEQATYTEFLPRANNYAPNCGGLGGYEVIGNRAFPFTSSSSDRLQLSQTPVRSVLSVYEDPMAYGGQGAGAFPETSLLTAGQDYYLDLDSDGISKSGQLIRIGAWCGAPRCIKVSYVAGYTPDELANSASHFRQAVLEEFAFRYAKTLRGISAVQSGGGTIVSESLGDYQVTFQPPDNSPGLCAAAAGYLEQDFNWGAVI